PDGAYDRMIWACRVNTLFFLMDDFLELEVRVLPKPKKKSNGELGEAHGEFYVEKTFNAVFRAIESECTGKQFSQFVQVILDFLNAQAPRPYKDFQEYLDFRRINSGGYFVLANSRIALDIHLTDEELNEPMLAVCEVLALGELDLQDFITQL
ncbi:hypothetical protein C8J57DRAFT_976064, partial [Mycena rebaudengoi]